MRALREARLIPFEFRACYENMAVDEYLISYYKKTRKPALRIYGWSPPAISIGRYQNQDTINVRQCAEDNVKIVRRITGGGAIFHDSELTYSIVISDEDIGCRNLPIKESFETLNRFIIDMYKNLGLSASYAKNIFAGKKMEVPAQFCFSGNEEYDIIINNKKIGGNAQRRTGDVILQHGSIPVDINGDKINKYFMSNIDFTNFTSLKKLLNRDIAMDELTREFISSFKDITGLDLEQEEISGSEKEIIYNFIKEKYSKDRWNIGGSAE